MFTVYEAFVLFILFNRQSYVISDIQTSVVNESDTNYTMYNTFYYDSYQNISFANDFDLNKSSLNNTSLDVATEFESTLSVTEEDSDTSFQSDTNGDLFLFLNPDEDICNCDLSASVCDINCCCDQDCREEDVQIFSECSHQLLTTDQNYCYQKDIILRNNTVYKMVKNVNNPMFCIVHDNFKHRLHFKDMPVLKSHRDVITVLKYKYKSTYSWDTETENTYDSREPKAGNPIYITSKENSVNSPWSVPSPCLSEVCSCRQRVLYLEDYTSSCSHIIRDVAKDCERSDLLSAGRFLDFCLARPLADNVTAPCVTVVGGPRRQPRLQSDACADVVVSVRFLVEHEGGSGVTGVTAELEYGAIPLSEGGAALDQTFEVSFTWSGAPRGGKRSGRPGYRVGLPLLASTNGTAAEGDEETLTLSAAEDGALTVAEADADGSCGRRRRAVRFGMNLRTGCAMRVEEGADCSWLRSRVTELLLGPSGRHVFVGSFGDANVSRAGDWVEAFHSGWVGAEGGGDGGCSFSTGLRIHVLFSAVGPYSDPQYKVLGVRYLHASPSTFAESGVFSLWTSVSFFDATPPPVDRLAKVPSLEARLPDDFFYPFLGGGADAVTPLLLLMLSAVAVALC